MNTKLTKTLVQVALLVGSSYCLLGYAHAEEKPETNNQFRGIGIVVQFGLANGASPKEGVSAVSDSGNNLYNSDLYKEGIRHQLSFDTGTNMPFPRWVRVTWRKGPGIDYDFKNGIFFGGTVIGDYKVQVLSRIPLEVFKYVIGARGRVIVLRFRIKDDGVLLSWDIQETVTHPKGGRNLVFSMHSGDFPCETSAYQPIPDCTDGRLEDAPWYDPLWTGS